MNSKKVFFFYPSFEKGGATKILINVVNYLLKKKIKIILFSYNAKYKDFSNSNNLKIIGSKKKNKTRFFLNILTIVNLFKYLIKCREKVLIFSFQSHLPAIFIAKILNKKIIIRNSEEIIGATKYADKKVSALIIFFLKIIFYNFSNKIIAISEKSKASLEKIILNKKKIKLIYNPYLLNHKKKYFRKNNYKRRFNILCIGRFTKQKNFSLIIKAINQLSKKYSKIKLTLIGDGPKLNNFKKFVGKNIKILSWKNNLKNYFLKSDLFILPSYYEGLPNALIDAVHYGVPSISSDCSGGKDILLNNKGGSIFPINNLEKLKKWISFAILNPKVSARKALYAKKNSFRFSISNCKKFYEIINKEF